MGMALVRQAVTGTTQGGDTAPICWAASHSQTPAKNRAFVLGFVTLIQTFHVGEDLPAAKEKNNLLSLF